MLLVLETLGFALGAVAVLSAIGGGVTMLLLRDDRWCLLLAPAVGAGVLTVGFQFLTYVTPPHVVAVVVFVLGAALTSIVVLRRPPARPAFDEIGGALAITLAFCLALMGIVIGHGFSTLGSFPSDNIFIYVQAGQYLKDHSSPLLTGPAVANPGGYVVAVTGWSLPNSKGVFDAAASILTGLPVYAVFDLVDAIAIAITVGAAWFFVRSGLGGSRATGLLAAVLVATSQMLFWVHGNGFQQESIATPIFSSGLAIAAAAFRRRSWKAGLLAGVLGASLIGLYFPIAIIYIALAAVCFGVSVVVGGDRTSQLWRPLAGAIVGALVAGAAGLFAMVTHGLGIWLGQLKGERVTGGVSGYPAPLYILGQLPFAHRWEPMALASTALDRILLPALVGVSVAVVLLIVVGTWRQLTDHHVPEASLLVAGMLGVLYEVAIANFAYGYVKAITYIEPFICVAIAVGTAAVTRWLVRRSARWGPPAATVLVAILIGACAWNSAEMVRGFLGIGPAMTQESLEGARLANDIPTGSRVFVDAPAASYGDLVKAAAVVYFLPDRSVQVYSGDLRIGTFPDQTDEPETCAFDYVVSAQQPRGGFTIVDGAVGNGFAVYRRDGPSCLLAGWALTNLNDHLR